MKKVAFLIVVTLQFLEASSQTNSTVQYSEANIDKAARNTANNLASAFDQLKYKSTGDGAPLNFVVLPVRDNEGAATSTSKNLSRKIAGYLNQALSPKTKGKNIYCIVRSYLDAGNQDVIIEINKNHIKPNDDEELSKAYEKISKALDPDYLIECYYFVDNKNEELTIDSKYLLNRIKNPGKNEIVNAKAGRNGWAADAVWRSLLVPGWGQFHKGQTGKGVVIITGTALLVGSTLACHFVGDYYYRTATQQSDIRLRRYYNDKYQTWETVKWVNVGILGALYLYNLIDAVAVKPKDKKVTYRIQPSSSEIGIAFNLKF